MGLRVPKCFADDPVAFEDQVLHHGVLAEFGADRARMLGQQVVEVAAFGLERYRLAADTLVDEVGAPVVTIGKDELGAALDGITRCHDLGPQAHLAEQLGGVGQLGLPDVESRQCPPLEHQNGAAGSRQEGRGDGAGRASPDDDDIDFFYWLRATAHWVSRPACALFRIWKDDGQIANAPG
jgi:hypothetical protein